MTVLNVTLDQQVIHGIWHMLSYMMSLVTLSLFECYLKKKLLNLFHDSLSTISFVNMLSLIRNKHYIYPYIWHICIHIIYIYVLYMCMHFSIYSIKSKKGLFGRSRVMGEWIWKMYNVVHVWKYHNESCLFVN